MRFNPEHFQNVKSPIFVTPSGRRIPVKTGAAGKRTIAMVFTPCGAGKKKAPPETVFQRG